jgi:hypothetical protein
MRVKSVTVNWHQSGSIGEGYTAGCNYDWFEVGRNGVTEIIENAPTNGMELWNFVIRYEDGKTFRVFNPNEVEYFANK